MNNSEKKVKFYFAVSKDGKIILQKLKTRGDLPLVVQYLEDLKQEILDLPEGQRLPFRWEPDWAAYETLRVHRVIICLKQVMTLETALESLKPLERKLRKRFGEKFDPRRVEKIAKAEQFVVDSIDHEIIEDFAPRPKPGAIKYKAFKDALASLKAK